MIVVSGIWLSSQPAPSRKVIFSAVNENSEMHALGFIDDRTFYCMGSSWTEVGEYVYEVEQNISAVTMDGKFLWTKAMRPISTHIGPDKVLYACWSVDGNWPSNLTAIQPNGTVKWSLPDMYITSMMTYGGLLYASSYGGLYAIDGNGTVLWQTWGNGEHAAMASNGTLILYGGNSLSGHNRTDGSLLWYTYLPENYLFGGMIDGEHYYALRNNLQTDYSNVYGDTYNYGGLFAFDINGTQLWKYPQDRTLYYFDTTLKGEDGSIYLLAQGLHFRSAKTDDFLIKLNANGTMAWSYSELHLFAPTFSGEDILVWNKSGLLAFKPDGSKDWSLTIKFYDPPGSLYAVDIDRSIAVGPKGEIALSDIDSFHTIAMTTPSSDPMPIILILLIAGWGAVVLLVQAKLRKPK